MRPSTPSSEQWRNLLSKLVVCISIWVVICALDLQHGTQQPRLLKYFSAETPHCSVRPPASCQRLAACTVVGNCSHDLTVSFFSSDRAKKSRMAPCSKQVGSWVYSLKYTVLRNLSKVAHYTTLRPQWMQVTLP